MRTGPFENDDALEFLDDLEEAEPEERPVKVVRALRRVVGTDGYIEAPLMAEAVAAAVVVAGSVDPECLGRERYRPVWIEEDPLEVDDDLDELAATVLRRALRHDDNEWWELWDEADATDEVTETVSRYLDVLGD
ncbi:MAG TPA: DUF4259 domain-containing protein [Pedococcus sp.]